MMISPKACALGPQLLSRSVPQRIRGAPPAQATCGCNALVPSMERTIGEAAACVAARHRAKLLIKKGFLLSASQARCPQEGPQTLRAKPICAFQYLPLLIRHD